MKGSKNETRILTRAEKEAAFEEAEGTLRLEGLTPTPFFQAVKNRVLAGKISIGQAKAEIVAHHITRPTRTR